LQEEISGLEDKLGRLVWDITVAKTSQKDTETAKKETQLDAFRKKFSKLAEL
jgi:hypothetical protein